MYNLKIFRHCNERKIHTLPIKGLGMFYHSYSRRQCKLYFTSKRTFSPQPTRPPEAAIIVLNITSYFMAGQKATL